MKPILVCRVGKMVVGVGVAGYRRGGVEVAVAGRNTKNNPKYSRE